MNLQLDAKIFNPLFFKLLNIPKEKSIVISYGSAGSGKSFSQLQFFIYKCLTNPNQNLLCIRQNYVDTKNSILNAFIFVLKMWNIYDKVKINLSERTITFKNGSVIFMKGLEAGVDNLKSLIVTDLWIEEASQIEESDFNQLLLRLRGQQAKNGKVWVTTNPTNTNIFIYRRFFENPNPTEMEDVEILHSTYLENKFLTPKDRKTIENFKSIDYNYFKCYGLGEWSNVSQEGLFYQDFKIDKSVKEIKYNPNLPLHISFDENSRPFLSLIVSQFYNENGKTKIKVFKIYALYSKNLDYVLKQFITDFHNHHSGLFVYGDSTSAKSSVFLEQDQNFYSIIMLYLQRFNPQKRVLPSNNSVVISGMYMNKIFRGENDKIEVEIDYNCKELINDLENCKTAPDGNKDKSIFNDKARNMKYQRYGHLSDALTYLVIQANIQDYNNFKVGSTLGYKIGGALRKERGY